MTDIDVVKKIKLPVDELIQKKYRMEDFTMWKKLHRVEPPFESVVTLDFVKYTGNIIKNYIEDLLSNTKQYGLLYYLNRQTLIIPLCFQYNTELVFDFEDRDKITEEIEKIVQQFDPSIQNITRLEIIYFLTMLVNPKLNWVAVDYLLRGNKYHSYVIRAMATQ